MLAIAAWFGRFARIRRTLCGEYIRMIFIHPSCVLLVPFGLLPAKLEVERLRLEQVYRISIILMGLGDYGKRGTKLQRAII
ncbi:hypothetical protein MPER_09332 [Moniliophthora perniciosa FA553]|nr:hypothetical protein MPER_09332 [Moniliophthora perniciosa FA553]